VLPQVRPGLIAGSCSVFLPATGQFVIPDLLGGARTALLGNVLQQEFGPSRDWPFGSAIAGRGSAAGNVGCLVATPLRRPKRRTLGSMRRLSLPLASLSAALYLFLYAPIVVVMIYSFNAASSARVEGFHGRWYRTLLETPRPWPRKKNTAAGDAPARWSRPRWARCWVIASAGTGSRENCCGRLLLVRYSSLTS